LNKYLITLVFILTIVFGGCRHLPCRDCVFVRKTTLEIDKVPFSDTASVLYKVSIKLYSMYFSGILAVKKIEKDHFRMSLISETGFKLFDMEVINGIAEMKNVFAELDRPSVKKTFREDLAIMVQSGIRKRDCNGYVYENSDDFLFECSVTEELSQNFLIDQKSGILKKTWIAEDINETVFDINYGYDESGSMTPAFITIVHYNVQLRMEFSLIKEENVSK